MNPESIVMAEIEDREEKSSSAQAGPAPASGRGNETRVFRTPAELEELRAAWTAWEGHPHSDLDFLLMLCQSRDEILSPYVIAVYRDGKPDALLAGRLENRQIRYRIGYLPAFRTTARSLTFQYGGLRGNASDENCKKIVLAILASLGANEADMATLDYPRTDSCLYKSALSLPGFLSRDFASVAQKHHQVLLRGTYEELFRSFSGSLRQELRNHGKKLEKKLGERAKIRCYREVSELDTAIALVESIASKTYHRGLGVGFDASPRSRQSMEFHARNGQLRMYVIFDEDKPIGFWVGVVYGNWFYCDHTGFDSEYRDCSPAKYLLVKMIGEFCEQGLQGVDFGLGDAEYKRRFGNETFDESPVSFFAPRPKGMAIKAAHSLTGGVSIALKEVLSRMNLLIKLKKRWRDHLERKRTSGA